jgi:hypothetical protein
MNEGIQGFRGLYCPPRTEFEVVALFGMLLPYLEDDFVLVSYGGGFPDAVLLRNGKELRAEFEVYTSNFFEHGHHEDSKAKTCNLIVVWKNNLPELTVRGSDGREYIKVTETHKVEVLSLHKIVERLEKEGTARLLMKDSCPRLIGGEEEFFSQLKMSVDDKRYELIRELYKYVRRRSEDFDIEWGHGKRWYTMGIKVRRWGISPIGIEASGLVWIVYTANPAQKSYWELPKETAEKLRKLFKHPDVRWKTVPLNTADDLKTLKTALEILADDSKSLKLVIHYH